MFYAAGIVLTWAAMVLFHRDPLRSFAFSIFWPIVGIVFWVLLLAEIPVRVWRWLRHPAPGLR